jgi:hypothetical protein
MERVRARSNENVDGCHIERSEESWFPDHEYPLSHRKRSFALEESCEKILRMTKVE